MASSGYSRRQVSSILFLNKVKLTDSRQQSERDWVLAEFKSGRSPIMLATDVASRGLGMFLFSATLQDARRHRLWSDRQTRSINREVRSSSRRGRSLH